MKTIFFTISRGSLIRNYFQTGVIDSLLKNGNRVVILSPHFDDKGVFGKYYRENLFFEPLLAPKNLISIKIFSELLRGVVYSKTVRTLYRHRLSGAKPNKLFYYPRIVAYFFLKNFPGIKKILRYLVLKLEPTKRA